MKFLNTSTKQDNTNKINLHPWRGIEKEWKPFLSWGEKKEDTNWYSLEWYQIYNKSKHERYGYFDKHYFGHYHINQDFGKSECIYNIIKKIW